ncbi:MAG: tetratricopeptide repeat protein [bacterium]|nr:tetratricopeptide repeat protein [bacterium]
MKEIRFKLSIFEKAKSKKPLIIREWLILFFIFFVIFSNFQRFFVPLVKELQYITVRVIKYPNFTTSYDEKMKEKVGKDYYDWSKLTRAHTSSDSFVFHPPQMWPWPQSGNPEFTQYFLYPAKLIREDRGRLLIQKDITQVLIAWGEGEVTDSRLYGWPKFPVFARKIYYLPQKRKVEVQGLSDLKEWANDAERTVNSANRSSFDITYTSSFYDYWIKPVKYVLLPSTNLEIKVKANWPNSVSLIARVSYGVDRTAVFSSSPNQKTDDWEILSLENLYQKAVDFGRQEGWGVGNLLIDSIGIDTGHPALMPYREKWGFIEVERGGQDRVKLLDKSIVNNQDYLSLGNISMLNEDYVKALAFYQKSTLLESSNPWSHFGVAEASNKIGNKKLAQQEYEEAIRTAPEDAWFYYALGKFFQGNNNMNKAIELYQKSLDYYPDSPWANLGMGDAYFAENRPDLAARHYRLASLGPRKDFSSDGKLAWNKLIKIEDEQRKVVKEYLLKLSDTLDEWSTRVTLGKAYVVLGDLAKAKEQYQQAYKINPADTYQDVDFPPNWTDQLNQPVYGEPSRAVDFRFVDNRPVAELNDYHSYLKFSPEFFPIEYGAIEVKWRMPQSYLTTQQNPLNILYQFNGFILWFEDKRFHLSLFDQKLSKWHHIKSSQLGLSDQRWYKIRVTYGDKGESLFLDGVRIAKGTFAGGINPSKEIYLGKGYLWSLSQDPTLSGYFDTLEVYDYQKGE